MASDNINSSLNDMFGIHVPYKINVWPMSIKVKLMITQVETAQHVNASISRKVAELWEKRVTSLVQCCCTPTQYSSARTLLVLEC